MGRIRTISRLRAGGSGTDADAAAWAAAVTANSGTYSASTLAALSTLIKALRGDGLWPNAFAGFGPLCGNDLAAALVMYLNGAWVPATNVNFVSGDYSESTGLTGNGSSKYLNTGMLASTLTLNSTHIAIYNRSSTASIAANFSGADDSTNFLVLGCPTISGTISSYQACLPANKLDSAAIGTPYGLLVGTRTASNAQAVYRNGAPLATNALVSSALPSQNFLVFARTGNGTPTDYGSNTFAAYSVGSGLNAADVTAYNTHMEAFQDALGRGVQ